MAVCQSLCLPSHGRFHWCLQLSVRREAWPVACIITQRDLHPGRVCVCVCVCVRACSQASTMGCAASAGVDKPTDGRSVAVDFGCHGDGTAVEFGRRRRVIEGGNDDDDVVDENATEIGELSYASFLGDPDRQTKPHFGDLAGGLGVGPFFHGLSPLPVDISPKAARVLLGNRAARKMLGSINRQDSGIEADMVYVEEVHETVHYCKGELR